MNRHLHSLVAQLSPSPEQTPPIQARDSDVVVTAGAGAGKTRTLVARYLALLADGVPLREIVAITFTKKAAREMRNRVRQEVRRYLERDALSADERDRWRHTYTQLDAARIGTIHSLCAEILRHHPTEVGIDPRFELLEEGQMALLQAQAVDTALGWATDQDDVVPLFDAFDERALRRILDDLLTQRLDVAEARAQVGDALWARWQSYLVVPLRAFVDDPAVQAGFADLTALRADGTLQRAADARDQLVPDLRAALAAWDAIAAARQADDWVTISQHLAPLRDHLKQKGRKANWAPARPKPIIKELQACYDETVKPLVKSGIDLALDRRLAQELVPALLHLYDYALEHYEQVKRTQQALDFDDLEAQALTLLQTHAAVRAYWQEQLQALLVDEFQDTNGRQRDLLHALNGDAGRLFIVGDAKQSIYRFRGADVTVFRAERAAIDAAGVGFALATSYRAHRDLVRSLNALLRPVLGEADPARPYVEPFAPLRHHREDPVAGLTPPYVELQLTVGSKSDGALERAAQVLAARLATLVETGAVQLPVEQLVDGQAAMRPLDYGDVAILCRASTSFAAHENALEAAGIPFLTVAGRGFYDRPEVRDLLNALQALADPTDDLALVGLLRSPVMGLSDMALYRLRRAQQDADVASLWALLAEADLAFLETEVKAEAERVLEARNLIRCWHEQVGRTAVADVLKAFLDATGYRAALLRAGEERAAHNVAKLLSDAHASEIVGVGTFVAYVAELRDVAPREGEARSIAAGAVQIMTVHQAKGLEFPVVVIGDAARTDPRPRGGLIDARLGVVPPLTQERLVGAADGTLGVEQVTAAAYRLAQEQEQDEEAAESARLLYVAATRARELLWINGTVRAKSGGLGTYGWLDRLDAALHISDRAPACAADGDAVHHFTLDLEGQPVSCVIYEPEATLPSVAVEHVVQPAVTPPGDLVLLAPVRAATREVDADVRAAERDPPRRVWRVVPEHAHDSAPAWVVGALVHEALAAWRFPADAEADFAAWARARARSYGLTDRQQLADAVRRSRRLLTRFWQHPLYSEMDGAEQRLHEVPYSRPTTGGRESGSIDALFKQGGDWILVEYKTDYVASEAQLEALLAEEDYLAQVRQYAEAIVELLGERPTCYLCFLNYRGQVRLHLVP